MFLMEKIHDKVLVLKNTSKDCLIFIQGPDAFSFIIWCSFCVQYQELKLFKSYSVKSTSFHKW